MPSFNPDRDIPDLSGKVVLITGGTSGIGRETVLALARHNPEHIYFTGRNAAAAAAVISEARGGGSINAAAAAARLTFIPCDLAAPRGEIRRALASAFASPRLDLLIANAGVMATPAGVSAEGWEVQWATNYVGHAVLLRLLRPLMLRTRGLGADVRLVSVSSYGHRYAGPGGVAFDRLREAEGVRGEFARYGQSKLGSILLCKAMARHHPEITSVSLHPGVVRTGLLSSTKPSAAKLMLQAVPFLKSAGEGAHNTLWAATADVRELENGAYYEPVGKMKGGSKMVNDEKLAERLWEWTENELQDLEDLC